MKRTGTIVAAEISGNITRPPYRSVSAPTMIRPSDPTRTGTATSSATSDSDNTPSDPESRNIGPRGLIKAHAQKFTAKPAVASASITQALPGTGARVGLLALSVCWVVTAPPETRRAPQCPRTLALPRAPWRPPWTWNLCPSKHRHSRPLRSGQKVPCERSGGPDSWLRAGCAAVILRLETTRQPRARCLQGLRTSAKGWLAVRVQIASWLELKQGH